MKILFSGGGTMGSVSPLVAIYEELKTREPSLEVLWLGTKNGPEKELIAKYSIPFKTISAAKLRRYFSGWNIIAPFIFICGFVKSFFILRKFKPEVILTAGSFVAVPVVYAARFLKIKIFVHQQDLEIGLANKLMAKKADVITVTFPEQIESFDKKKTVCIGNPVRTEIFSGSREKAIHLFQLNSDLPIILIIGGGTGAQTLNQAVLESIGYLASKYQVIHLAGKGKTISGHLLNYYSREQMKLVTMRYREYGFLNREIFDALAAADLIISRAGFSALTEFAVLGKPAVVIPIPGHQEINAKYFAKNNAVKILAQSQLNKDSLVEVIEYFMRNSGDRLALGRNIFQLMAGDAARKYVDLIFQHLNIHGN
ncbi:MAG: undecaprenyldiphospho-muramoylpentapeptide beta-N-acetylglucosaminyltransferase [Candidatus Parcubacteria bacterium]|nr:undecaprenyldiphospho-muramoylpentapeptide beta-N-acetylglucosaminyltransferase [Candidatus Parcubacteria bacterium]